MTTRTAAGSTIVATSEEKDSVLETRPGRNGPGPVLLALHGHEGSDAAGLAAHLAADRMRADLRIITVIEPMPSVTGPDGMPMVAGVTLESWEAREDAVLRRLSLVPTRGKKREIDVRFGQVVGEIVRAAEEMEASVIVVDAAPHHRLRHTVSGQCAAHVLRKTHVPVLSVSPGFSVLPRRAVVAIDFSPASVEAARFAVRLLAENGELTLLHIAPLSVSNRMVTGEDADTMTLNIRKSLQRIADEILPLAGTGTVIQPRVTTGVVISQILRIADELEADLIAVGTHGPGIVERLFLGSVAGTVLELAGTTVLAAPAPEPKKAAFTTTGTSVSNEPERWRTWLDEFSKRNVGRPLDIEVDDPAIGAQLQARGYLLHGAVCDPSDNSIEIMLGAAPGGEAHLTRKIEDVNSLAISMDVRGRDAALEVEHGEGRTLVIFKD
jgi:nucleotide-binding universal stress UspA family protein